MCIRDSFNTSIDSISAGLSPANPERLIELGITWFPFPTSKAVSYTHLDVYKRQADERRSQFARASVDVLDRYVVAATIRRDGTDKFRCV